MKWRALASDPLSWLTPQHFTTLNKAKAGKMSGSWSISVSKKLNPLTPRRLLHDKSALLQFLNEKLFIIILSMEGSFFLEYEKVCYF